MVVDLVHRHDACRVHDRGVEAGLHALVEEHAVEHVPQRGLEAEAHVRHAEHGGHAGELGLDAADGLDRLDAVAPQVLLAGAERERERVEDEVGRLDAVALDGEVVDALADANFQSAVRAWPSSSIARQITAAPYSRASGTRGRSREPGPSPSSRLAELRIALPPECCSPASITSGSVESSTSGSGAWVAKRTGDLVHVGDAVAADVVDAHVEHVRALLHLLARHLDAGVPVGVEHRVAELLRAVRVRALADERGYESVLVERDVRVDRRAPGLVLGRARDGRAPIPTRSTTARRCSGVVPQQPPTMLMPNSLTKRSCASASSSGVRS